MAITTHRVVSYSVDYDDGDNQVSFEVEHKPDDSGEVIVRELQQGGWVVGYLSHDDICENPLETSDCQGHIYTARRHVSREEHQGFQEALGLDSDWRRDRSLKPNPLAVILDCYDHGNQVWAVSGSMRSRMFPDQQWDVAHGGGVWVPDDGAMENIHMTAMKSWLPKAVYIGYESEPPYGADGKGYLNRIVVKIKVGDALKSLQSHRSKHCKVSLPNEINLWPKGYKSFDSAIRAAYRFLGIKPNPQEYKKRLRDAAVAYAETILEEYNAWLSGDAWGVCVEVFNAEAERIDSDSCWGHIGHAYAKEELTAAIDAAVKSQEKETP